MIRQAHVFQAKKRLGQNFLVSPEILEEIAANANLKPGQRVLEIGPGLGFLTRFLCETGALVTAVELDQDCVNYLKNLDLPNLHLVHDDFLRTDISKLMGDKFKVCANVPYQITAPIIVQLFGEIDKPRPWLHLIQSIVLTVQYEVAERFTAQPGGKEYSQITLLTQYYSKAEMIRVVERENFTPVPEVTSAVVKFTPLTSPAVACRSPRLLRQLIQAGFRQRRKMLRNNLAFLNLPGDEMQSIFSELKLDPQVRAERLSLQQFSALADAVEERREAHKE